MYSVHGQGTDGVANIKTRFKATGNQSGAVESLKDGFEALKVHQEPDDDMLLVVHFLTT